MLILSPRASLSSSTSAAAAARGTVPICWTGETSASIEIRAPASMLLAAYSDIESMPRWSPMLESVKLVDEVALHSEWSLRIPRPLSPLLKAAGMARLVNWRAVHEVDSRAVRWQSLSGVQNAGEATFDPTPGRPGCTTVTLSMSYTLPSVAGPIVETSVVQNFVRRTLLSTMERFRMTLEAEAAATAGEFVGDERCELGIAPAMLDLEDIQRVAEDEAAALAEVGVTFDAEETGSGGIWQEA